MSATLRIRPGLLGRLRKMQGIDSEDVQARMIGVDRTTLRRIDAGGSPSSGFIASMVVTYNMGIGEMFEVVTDSNEVAA